jgi:hypothetical protein
MREVYRGLGRDVDTGRSACLTYLTSKMPEFQKALHEARRAAQPDPARRDDGDGSSGRGGRRARACVVRITSRSTSGRLGDFDGSQAHCGSHVVRDRRAR